MKFCDFVNNQFLKVFYRSFSKYIYINQRLVRYTCKKKYALTAFFFIFISYIQNIMFSSGRHDK